MLVVTTYVDGAYWRSALEVLVSPLDCTFYRSFSYRTELIGSLEKERQYDSGFIGVRFRGERNEDESDNSIFIPLRRIDQISFDDDGEVHIGFRLGQYVVHPEPDRLVAIDLSEFLSEKEWKGKLLLHPPAGLAERLNDLECSDQVPADLWKKLLDDPHMRVLAAGKMERTSLLRVVKMVDRETNKRVEPTLLERKGNTDHFGYRLVVNQLYDLDLEQRTLVDESPTTELQGVPFEAVADPANLQLSKESLPRTGHYRQERIWLKPAVENPAPVVLEWQAEPVEGGVASKLPYMASPPALLKFRPGTLWLGALSLLAAVFFFYLAVAEPPPTTGATGTTHRSLAGIWTALGALLFPVGVNALSRWWDAWERIKK